MKIKGIDVSHWQGDIDWKQVKSDGVEFTFIKATQGNDCIDEKFAENVKGAYEAGIKVGAYHFGEFGSITEALAEAKYFLNVISTFNFSYPLVLDIEQDKKQVGKKVLTDASLAFLNELIGRGYSVMLYTGKSFLESNLDEDKLKQFPFWIARYGDILGRPAGIWQYSQEGKVKGIKGNVDLNWAFADYSHGTKGPIAKVQPVVIPVVPVAKVIPVMKKPEPRPTYYVVKRGDSVSEIAVKYGTTVEQIQKWNKLKDPDVIYNYQRLRVK